ncbi:MAG: uracil-DNA glycosylase family protein [Alphaproteobacteria bacterium]|nr:uracil-DNA glycosylase family protein [Alphaproteobacteria bacterium]
MGRPASALEDLRARILACRLCEGKLPEPRPVLRVSKTARLCIAGQAPGTRVHATGIPFNDPSGDRLRAWMGIDRDTFYDETRIAIVPMGFCFPGLDQHGGDRPPRPECARTWRADLFGHLPQIETTLLVGAYAQAWHLGKAKERRLSETVRAWPRHWPRYVPLPHPSWRNNAWLKRNPWFEAEILPALQERVRALLV